MAYINGSNILFGLGGTTVKVGGETQTEWANEINELESFHVEH